jgi:hypothetical protein
MSIRQRFFPGTACFLSKLPSAPFPAPIFIRSSCHVKTYDKFYSFRAILNSTLIKFNSLTSSAYTQRLRSNKSHFTHLLFQNIAYKVRVRVCGTSAFIYIHQVKLKLNIAKFM